MKTAMQILIDEMTEYLTLSESKEVREVLMILKSSAIRKHWKEEKEHIVDAFDQGYVSGHRDNLDLGAEYYNEKYQNK